MAIWVKIGLLTLALVQQVRMQEEVLEIVEEEVKENPFKHGQLQTVVNYLGDHYLLKDGCPLPDCDAELTSCFKRQLEVRKNFNGCLSGDDGEALGCMTDRLPSGAAIILPVMAHYCSRLCYYHGNEEMQQKIHKCPYAGKVHKEVDRLVQHGYVQKFI